MDHQLLLADWRSLNGNPFGDEDHKIAEPLAVEVKAQADRIDLVFADGRSVWIEQEGGTVTVHAYDPAHDEPVNVRIGLDAITVDADDRDPV